MNKQIITALMAFSLLTVAGQAAAEQCKGQVTGFSKSRISTIAVKKDRSKLEKLRSEAKADALARAKREFAKAFRNQPGAVFKTPRNINNSCSQPRNRFASCKAFVRVCSINNARSTPQVRNSSVRGLRRR